ncbi:MAG: Hsp20 family protein, partial [Coriobacteriia bacterium]|nr:Hsp20 family protein [Coriobacteriia bacterium]
KDAQDLDESKELSKQEDNQKHYIHRERMSYSASRRIFLKNSESEGIKASLKDGVLTIVVPKKAADKKDPHKIEIE